MGVIDCGLHGRQPAVLLSPQMVALQSGLIDAVEIEYHLLGVRGVCYTTTLDAEPYFGADQSAISEEQFEQFSSFLKPHCFECFKNDILPSLKLIHKLTVDEET